MKTFNIWKDIAHANSSTGGWVYMCAVLATDAQTALETAKSRYGLTGEYRVYEGL